MLPVMRNGDKSPDNLNTKGAIKMRITRKRYETAIKKLEELDRCQQIVEIWENGLERIGSVGSQTVTAFEIDEDGRITKPEFEPPAFEVVAEQREA